MLLNSQQKKILEETSEKIRSLESTVAMLCSELERSRNRIKELLMDSKRHELLRFYLDSIVKDKAMIPEILDLYNELSECNKGRHKEDDPMRYIDILSKIRACHNEELRCRKNTISQLFPKANLKPCDCPSYMEIEQYLIARNMLA